MLQLALNIFFHNRHSAQMIWGLHKHTWARKHKWHRFRIFIVHMSSISYVFSFPTCFTREISFSSIPVISPSVTQLIRMSGVPPVHSDSDSLNNLNGLSKLSDLVRQEGDAHEVLTGDPVRNPPKLSISTDAIQQVSYNIADVLPSSSYDRRSSLRLGGGALKTLTAEQAVFSPSSRRLSTAMPPRVSGIPHDPSQHASN